MTREEKIKAHYEFEMQQLHDQQNRCNHRWTAAIYDPEITNEPIAWETTNPTAHPELWNYVPVKFKQNTTDRWKRECPCCGKVEYTTDCTVKIIEEKTPVFK